MYDDIGRQLRIDKANKLKKSFQGQQKMISAYKNDSQLATVLSFRISNAITEKGKPFSDSEFIKHFLIIFAELACLEKNKKTID